VTVTPNRFNNSPATIWFSGSSSTSNTCAVLKIPATAVAAGLAGAFSMQVVNAAVNINVLPRPTWLSSVILPPINRASDWLIISPKPLPPYCRDKELSACENG